MHEAARGVVAQVVQHRDPADQHGVELACDLDVVGIAARAFAQRREVEPGHVLAARAHRDPAPVDLDAGVAVAVVAAQLAPARLQPGMRARVERRAVDRRAGQRAQPVVGVAVQVHDLAVALHQLDRRQEARALQAVAVKVGRVDVGRGDQNDALGEHALQQPRQDHGVADVADEELVEHQHAHPASPFAHDRRQRVTLAGVGAQLRVHAAHEAVEVGAALARRATGRRRLRQGAAGQRRAAHLRQRQRGVEQVDQEGLAAAHPAPQVQALWRLLAVVAQQAREQPGARRRLQQRGVDAVERLQRLALRRVLAPLAAFDPGAVVRRRRHRRVRLNHRRQAGRRARRA